MYDFVLDAMLGKEARWLRVLGYSVFYSPEADDNELIKVASKDNSILITKDLMLFRRAIKENVKCICIKSNNVESFLKTLKRKIGLRLKIDLNLTRCPLCNGILSKISSDEVIGLVPNFIANKYTIFLKCDNCGHIYWPGTHLKRMEELLKKVVNNGEIESKRG